MPKYLHLHISVNNVSAQNLKGISRKYHRRIVKNSSAGAATGKYMLVIKGVKFNY